MLYRTQIDQYWPVVMMKLLKGSMIVGCVFSWGEIGGRVFYVKDLQGGG